MKNAAYLSVALSILLFAFAIMYHMGAAAVGRILNLTPEGFLNVASVLLLFGINFTLLELSNKK